MARLVWSVKGDLAVVTTSKVKILSYSDGSTKLAYAINTNGSQVEDTRDEEIQQSREGSALGKCLLCCFSRSGNLFALCCDKKTLVLWNIAATQEYLSMRKITKRATAIVFDHKEEYIMVADKGGDVYSFSVKTQEPGILILGHVSMILDMVITRDDKFIITSDRDEKIRISHYPNSYNIECYCLGHTDFVGSLSLSSPAPNSEILVSTSGDGQLIFWDYKQGKAIQKLNIHPSEDDILKKTENPATTTSCLACCHRNSVVSVTLEKSCQVLMYHMDKENTVCKLPVLECDAPPWHVSFDPDGRMWLAQPHSQDPVIVFEPGKDSDNKFPLRYCKVRSFDFPLLQEASDWSFLKECVGNEPNLCLLRKKEFDNMAEYLARKEQRLKTKNPDKSSKRPTEEHPTKRAKLQT